MYYSLEETCTLALGTAQLGMAYGVANRIGKPSLASVKRIVEASWAGGIRCFDTAQAYGDSELELGRALSALGLNNRAIIISKLDPMIDPQSSVAVRQAVLQSCARLGVPCLHGFLLHNERLLDKWDSTLRLTLLKLKDEGYLRHVGVSVYSVEGARRSFDFPDLEFLQIPGSLFDRRMIRAGIIQQASETGRQVFVRSVFLQGLILMAESEIPEGLEFSRPAIRSLEHFCARHKIDRRSFAIGYMKRQAAAATLIIGAESSDQVEDNCRTGRAPHISPTLCEEWDCYWPEDQYPLVYPPCWPRQ